MKPDWKDAPEWARWLAEDSDGICYWHEKKPRLDSDGVWMSAGKIALAGHNLIPRCEARPS